MRYEYCQKGQRFNHIVEVFENVRDFFFFFKPVSSPPSEWERKGIQFQWFLGLPTPLQGLTASGNFVWPQDMRGEPLLSHASWSLQVPWPTALGFCSVPGKRSMPHLPSSLYSTFKLKSARCQEKRHDCHEQRAAWLTLLIIWAIFPLALKFWSLLRKQSINNNFPFPSFGAGKRKRRLNCCPCSRYI